MAGWIPSRPTSRLDSRRMSASTTSPRRFSRSWAPQKFGCSPTTPIKCNNWNRRVSAWWNACLASHASLGFRASICKPKSIKLATSSRVSEPNLEGQVRLYDANHSTECALSYFSPDTLQHVSGFAQTRGVHGCARQNQQAGRWKICCFWRPVGGQKSSDCAGQAAGAALAGASLEKGRLVGTYSDFQPRGGWRAGRPRPRGRPRLRSEGCARRMAEVLLAAMEKVPRGAITISRLWLFLYGVERRVGSLIRLEIGRA